MTFSAHAADRGEPQAMEQELRSRGHEVVEFSDEADAYVINSCSVTAVSDQKSRKVLLKVAATAIGVWPVLYSIK